jgi:hypothetical protein
MVPFLELCSKNSDEAHLEISGLFRDSGIPERGMFGFVKSLHDLGHRQEQIELSGANRGTKN